MHQNPDLVKIATGFGSLDSYALKAFLNSYGIEVMLDNSYFSAALPHYVYATNGMNIWVFASDWPIVKNLIEDYKNDNQQGQDLGYFATSNNVAFVFLWIVLMVSCSTPPPARGVYFTQPEIITRILMDEKDGQAT